MGLLMGLLMALECTNSTQSRADPHPLYPHSAWQQLPQLGVQEGCTASLPEFLGYQIMASLALGSSWLAQALPAVPSSWHSCLERDVFSQEQAEGCGRQTQVTRWQKHQRTERLEASCEDSSSSGPWAPCQALAEVKVSEVRQRSP